MVKKKEPDPIVAKHVNIGTKVSAKEEMNDDEASINEGDSHDEGSHDSGEDSFDCDSCDSKEGQDESDQSSYDSKDDQSEQDSNDEESAGGSQICISEEIVPPINALSLEFAPTQRIANAEPSINLGVEDTHVNIASNDAIPTTITDIRRSNTATSSNENDGVQLRVLFAKNTTNKASHSVWVNLGTALGEFPQQDWPGMWKKYLKEVYSEKQALMTKVTTAMSTFVRTGSESSRRRKGNITASGKSREAFRGARSPVSQGSITRAKRPLREQQEPTTKSRRKSDCILQ